MALTGTFTPRYANNATGSTIGIGTAITVASGSMTVCTGAGTFPNLDFHGVVQEDVLTTKDGEYAWKVGDVAKLLSGDTITEGDFLNILTTGAFAVLTAAGLYVAKAEEAADSGDLFRAQIIIGYYHV